MHCLSFAHFVCFVKKESPGPRFRSVLSRCCHAGTVEFCHKRPQTEIAVIREGYH